MKNSIFKLLETFSQEEWKACKNFLLAENKADSKVYKSFLYIYKHRSKTPNIDGLHKKVMPSSSRKNMLNTISLLKGHIEDFLVYQHVMKEEMLKNTILHRELLFRNNLPEADKLREGTISELVKNERYNLRDQMYIHLFLHDMFFSNTEYKYKYGHNLLEQSRILLGNYVDLLDLYYKTEKENHKFKNRGKPSVLYLDYNLSKEYSDFTKEVMEELYDLSSSNCNKSFQLVLQRLIKWNISDSNGLYSFILLHCIEYCIKQMRSGNKSIIDNLLDLYILGLRKEVFLEKGFISSRRFGNIIDGACIHQRFDWAYSVIAEYGHQIIPVHRNETILLANAQVLMAQEEYEKALVTFEDLRLINMDHKLRYRWCKLACLLELDRLLEFDSFINSTSIFIKRNRNKMSDLLFESLVNYLNIIRRIRNREDKQILRKEINNEKNIIFRSWLRKKLQN